MEWVEYAKHVAIVASSWMIGIFIARFILRKFFSINPDGPEIVNGGVSTDDVLQLDKAEMPFIPVKISKEKGIYYAWFENNNKFIGQSESEQEIEMMTYRHLLKLVNLRMEFKHEEDKVVSE